MTGRMYTLYVYQIDLVRAHSKWKWPEMERMQRDLSASWRTQINCSIGFIFAVSLSHSKSDCVFIFRSVRPFAGLGHVQPPSPLLQHLHTLCAAIVFIRLNRFAYKTSYSFCGFSVFVDFIFFSPLVWSVVVFLHESELWVHWKYYVCGLLCTFGEFISFCGTAADTHFFSLRNQFLRCGNIPECLSVLLLLLLRLAGRSRHRRLRRTKSFVLRPPHKRNQWISHIHVKSSKTNVCISKWSQKFYMAAECSGSDSDRQQRKKSEKIRLFRPNAPRSP